MSFPILTTLILLPLIGAAFILLSRACDKSSRWIALVTSAATGILSILLLCGFDKTSNDFQFVEQYNWLPSLGISYHVGIDGISLFFVVLSAILTPVCVLASWNAVTKRVREYMVAFLILREGCRQSRG